MSDSEDTPKAQPPKKRKSAVKRAKPESCSASASELFARESRTALEQIRASTTPAYAFMNPLESIDPLHSIRAVTEMSRGVSLAADDLSGKHIQEMMKGIDPLGQAKTASLMAQGASEALRILSHNPAKDAFEQTKATSQIFSDATSSMRGITNNSVHDILKNLDPLHDARAVSSLAADASVTLDSIAASSMKNMVKGLDSLHQASTVPQSIMDTSAVSGLAAHPLKTLASSSVFETMGASQTAIEASPSWQILSSNPLKDMLKTLNPLHQMKTVSQMASEASTVMFAATNPLRNVMKEFSAASDILRGVKELQHSLAYSPISHSIDALDQLKQIQKSLSITEIPLKNRVPAFGNLDFSTYLQHARPAFAGGFTAEAAQEAAISMAASISEEAVSAESEKLFSREEIGEVLAAVREVLLSKDKPHRNEVLKRFSGNTAFNFLMTVVVSILATYLYACGLHLSEKYDISNRSAPAIEYAMHSNDKPHIGIVRRSGGARVYEKPDKRSLPVHKFIDGEFIALMWDRQRGWRKVAYEVDLDTMKALKVGWIQEADYDRTNMPVKSIFLRLYVEQ